MANEQQAQILEIKPDGLYINPNNLSAVPAGSMAQADNVVLTKPNIVESRRGQQVYGTELSAIPDRLFNYRETLLNHTADGTLSYDSDGLGTWVAYDGTFDPPSSAIAIHSVEANKNFYFTSDTGIQKLDSVTGDVRAAGAPAALGGTGTTTGTTGFFLVGTNVAYKVVWGYTDANNNLILGAPSQDINVSNTTVNMTATTDGSTNVLTDVADTSEVVVNQIVTGVGIPEGSTVVSFVADTSITISANTTSANSNEPITLGFNTDVSLTFVIPQEIDETWFYQVYRSPFSANLTSAPGVEFAQVLQGNPTTGEIAAKEVTVIDNTPTDLVGALLYTNPSQLGAAAANYQPPLAADMCEYLGYTFYANTVEKQALELTLVGAGNGTAFSYISITGDIDGSTDTITNLSSTDNLRVGQLVIGTGIPDDSTIVSIDTGGSSMVISNDTTIMGTTVDIECEDGLTIAGVTYWGSSAPSMNNQFLVSTNGDPALAIQETAYNLINTINTYPANTIYAYYLSGFNSLPGLILFQEIVIGGSVFYATSTNGTSFNPALPSSGTTIASDNSANGNYLWWSAYSQPEAVPLANFVPVGSADFPIKRILALRTSVMIFKDDGIYRLFNAAPPFGLFLLDSTTLLSAPETAVNFNNQIYFGSLQGIASLSDNSTPVIISIPIDNELNIVSTYPDFSTLSFGVGYESDRTYLFATLTTIEDEFCTQIFAFNYVTNAWTRWLLDRSCGIISVPLAAGNGDLLYMGNPVSNFIYQERKSFTATDYADEQFEVEITTFNNFTVNLADTSDVIVGQTLGQGPYTAIVTEVVSGTEITVNQILGWTAGEAFVYNPIFNHIQWNPFTGDNPGIIKHFREASFFFRNAAFNQAIVSYSSDFASSEENYIIRPVSQFGWGNFQWPLPGNTTAPWGGQLGGMQAIRTYITPNQSRAHWLNVGLSSNQAFTSFSLQGISLVVEQQSERFR